ncbi:MAG: regulatory protein RecX [Anaeromyxobacter sp.]
MPPSTPETPLQRAKALALRAVARRAHTEAELRRKLAKAELDGEADAVMGWLAGLGYLDDRAFAAGRARALLRPGRVGPRVAEQKIALAGIGRDAARAAVAEALEAAGGRSRSELALCRALAERRARGGLEALDEKGRNRLARFLLGRGFSGGVVRTVVGGGWQSDPDE